MDGKRATRNIRFPSGQSVKGWVCTGLNANQNCLLSQSAYGLNVRLGLGAWLDGVATEGFDRPVQGKVALYVFTRTEKLLPCRKGVSAQVSRRAPRIPQHWPVSEIT